MKIPFQQSLSSFNNSLIDVFIKKGASYFTHETLYSMKVEKEKNKIYYSFDGIFIFTLDFFSNLLNEKF